MNVTGIIVEYNPFHNGHKYHIESARSATKCDAIIAVMSGNFVQRGAPSIIDKWTKTKMALLNGVDLVFELPVIYSLSSAEFFAYGAVSLLENLGVVNNLCFGSECSNINLLKSIAKILAEEPTQFKLFLKEKLSNGMSYPSARNSALNNFLLNTKSSLTKYNIDEILQSPNNILGIEYLKNLIRIKSNITPISIKRIGSSYNSLNIEQSFSSASSIRNFLKLNGNINELSSNVPENVLSILKKSQSTGCDFIFEDCMVPYLKYKSFLYENKIRNLPDISEGIENRILRSLQNNCSYNDIIIKSKTKRYTYSRISRILCQFFLGFENLNSQILRRNMCPYGRVLGFNSTGIKVLKEMKNSSSIPIYVKMPKKISEMLQLDIQATKAYSLLNKNISFNSDYLQSPIMADQI
jgi:predicted nucleotidyltransferase